MIISTEPSSERSKEYGHDEAFLVADWIAYERGLERLHDANLDLIAETLNELRLELEFNHDKHGSIVAYVRERAENHPNWRKFQTEATEREPGSTKEERQAIVEKKLMQNVQNLQHRTLTPPEVYEQFVRIYLEGKDAPVQIEFSVVRGFLESLGRHPEWSTDIEVHHDDSQENAEAHVARMWRPTVETFGPTVTPATFTSFFKKSHLDSSEQDRLDEAGAKASDLTVKLGGSNV